MKRLTERDGDGLAFVCDQDAWGIDRVVKGLAVERLAAYEDTGMTPEEVQNIVTFENEKLYPEKELTLFGKPISRWFELHAAEQEGRLVVLPCKVGDVVYVIIDGKIFCGEVYHISYSNYYGKVTATAWTKAGNGAAFEHFGKTVFLSRAEAEKAMEVSEDG